MSKQGYELATGGAVALAAATAKTVLCAISPATFGLDLQSLTVSFDGVTASAVPVLVELMTCTLATNSTPGTNNTTGTVTQIYGGSVTPGFTGFYASTSEPTVLTLIKPFLLTPTGGTLFYDWPMGRTPDIGVSKGMVIRCTAPAIVNVRAELVFER